MKKLVITFFIFFALISKAQSIELMDGIKLLNLNKVNKACEFFKNYTDNKPNDPDGHYWLGLCYKKAGQNELSAYHLQKSFELSQIIEDIDVVEPVGFKNQNDYLDIAQMYLESGDFDKAHTYTDMTLKLNPDSADAYTMRAKIYLAQNDKDNARKAAIRAIQADNNLLNSSLAKEFDIVEVPPLDFEYYNSKGVEYYYRGEIQNAISFFEKSLDLNFKNVVALNNLARAYIKMQDFNKAKSALKKARIFNPKYFETYMNYAHIAKLESTQSDISEFSRKRYLNEQKSYLKQAIKANPNDKRAYLELGNYYLEQKDYENAIENFSTALVYDDEYYEAYLGLAIAYIELNNPQKAILALRNAGALNSKSDEISYYLAKMCILDNRFDEAKDYLLDAVSKSDNPEYYLELGKIYYFKNDYKNAFENFQKTVSQDVRLKNMSQLYNYLGLCYYKNKDLKKALINLQKAVNLEPDNVIYMYNLSLVYKSTRQDDLYQKLYNKILRFEPKVAQDYIDLSTIYYDRGQSDIAKTILDNGIRKMPEMKALYSAKLRLLETLGDKENAKKLKELIDKIF